MSEEIKELKDCFKGNFRKAEKDAKEAITSFRFLEAELAFKYKEAEAAVEAMESSLEGALDCFCKTLKESVRIKKR
jgi:hypothetical protein